MVSNVYCSTFHEWKLYRPLAHDVKTVDLEDNFKVPTFKRVNE